MNFGKRLKEETRQIGLKLDTAAEVGAVSKSSQAKYEKGEGRPNPEYWENLAAAGVDIKYVLTGARAVDDGHALESMHAAVLLSHEFKMSIDDQRIKKLCAMVYNSDQDIDHVRDSLSVAFDLVEEEEVSPYLLSTEEHLAKAFAGLNPDQKQAVLLLANKFDNANKLEELNEKIGYMEEDSKLHG